ncbi:MAG: hypothetical protein RID09_19610 [Coleofasciculus sp. G1-WW12-02]|uniref:hypothetical protein n=2 Tax=unclassified Coleofasciculus TaxID=2692782 RepID=UPI0033045F85
MAEPNMLKLAKQGNPKAIAAMINRSLRAKHIIAKVNRQDDGLQVLVESAQIPNQKATVSFIRQGLTKLGIETIKTVQVYGRQKGQESFAWNQSFEIESSSSQAADVQDSDPDLNLHQTPADVAAENDTSSSFQSPGLEPPPGSNFAKVPSHAVGGYTSSHNRQTSAHTPHHSNQSSHSRPRQPMKPLSVGNVVSASLRLYRDRFKLYFGLAFQAFLWGIVPIYGWAKFYQIQGIISRHAVSEFAEQPETIDSIRTQLNPKMWDFWIAQILIGLISFGVNFALSILSVIIVSIPTMIVSTVFPDNVTLVAILNILGLVINVVSLFIFIWVYSHFCIAELPLAVEPGMSSTSCLDRSWQLTKGLVIQITGVITVAFLITIPLGVLAFIPIVLIIPSLFMAPSPEALISSLGVLIPLTFIMIILAGLLVMPFWQIIKAVIYYDLRNRREGMGLQLRH